MLNHQYATNLLCHVLAHSMVAYIQRFLIQAFMGLLLVSSLHAPVSGKAQVFDPNRCPVFQNGNPGSPNAFVTFFDSTNTQIVTCHCQLTGNELKCHNCKPPDPDWSYYQVVMPPDTLDTLNCFNAFYLSVELLSFSGYYENSSTHLHWTTTAEINNKKFYVERSADGTNPLLIGEIKGSGSIQHPKDYFFVDQFARAEEPYYRIIQEDFDGTKTPYPWIRVNTSDEQTSNSLVFPNPTNGVFHVLVRKEDNFEQATVIDATGRVVVDLALSEGLNMIDQDLKKGQYLVVLTGPNTVLRRKLVVTH